MAAEHKAQFNPPDSQRPALSVFFICPLRRGAKCRGRRKDCALGGLWLYVNTTRGQAADEPRPMYESVKMLLPVVASLFNLSHSSGHTRLFWITGVDLLDVDVVFRRLLKAER